MKYLDDLIIGLPPGFLIEFRPGQDRFIIIQNCVKWGKEVLLLFFSSNQILMIECKTQNIDLLNNASTVILLF